MASVHTLSAQRLTSFPLDRNFNRTTFIEEEPQEGLKSNQTQYSTLPTIVDDELPATRTISRQQHHHRKPAGFDDLYDMSDDETDDIPIRFSTVALSSGQPTPTLHKRFPSLVIPSPTAWPTIQNYQKQGIDAALLSPIVISPTIVSPTPRMLSQLAARPRDSTSTAPSLDGSLTSEELSSLSCPSTPDTEHRRQDRDWSSPVQLRPEALQTLTSITGNNAYSDSPILFRTEMREVNEQRPNLDVNVTITPVDPNDQSELSALSVPSPGGFFSALEPSTRHAWSKEETPSTSIAERFYGVPWAEEPNEQVIEYVCDDDNTEGPPTARRIPLASPRSVVSAPRSPSPHVEPSEYKDNYAEQLHANSMSNFDRTSMWLQDQEYLSSDDSSSVDSYSTGSSLPSTYTVADASSINSYSTGFSHQRKQSISPIEEVEEPEEEPLRQPSPKAVRFVDVPAPKQELPLREKTAVFVDAAREISETTGAHDAFVQRQARTDKLRLDRRCLFKTHVDRLEGKFEVDEEEPELRRPKSDMFGPQDTEESQAMAKTLKQRRALEHIRPVAWNLEATKMLNGGSLLTSPTGKLMPKIENGRVLDLGGMASCDWAWQVAFEHPSSTVHTVYTSHDQVVDPAIQGPVNHKKQEVPNLWTLPFPDNHFHLISARNLMALLKTDKPVGRARDEYDLCLRECMRVLKPGGYLEFALLDADIVGGGHQTSVTSVEFCFGLRSRGYDPAPTKVWLPRLRRAGFAQVRRAWLNLPLAQSSDKEGTTADASHISGLVGSWAWERWMLKMHRETGRDADRLLEGVPSALEEGSRTGASWRYLSGWARKPM